MNATEWGVVAAGAAAIAWIHWYFFLAGRTTVRAVADHGVQRVPIVVQGGYRPAEVRVQQGMPVRLLFDRREDSPCSEEVVIGELGLRRFLPAHAITAVDFVPEHPGTFEFTCGMSMLRGRITVEPREAR